MLFYYDAYVITALVPVAIPQNSDEPSGDLILYPQLRSIRSNVVANVLEKAVIQNRVVNAAVVQRESAENETREHLFFPGISIVACERAVPPIQPPCDGPLPFWRPHENNALTVFILRVRKWHEARKARACRDQSRN
jgi:hypothetical protein